MKRSITKRLFIISLITVLAMILSACGGTVPTVAGGAEAPAGDAPATEAPAAAETLACPYGTWQLTDFSGYLTSIQSEVSNINSDMTVSDLGATGTAIMTFNEDGTGSFSTDNFIESFTMTINAGGANMDIPITLTMNGTSTANYTIEGDQITFLDQDPGDLVIVMNMMGQDTPFDTSVLGEPGTTQLYQFSCADANTLSLKVTAITNMDLAPLILTRIP
jgi:hypothetical protein